MGLLDGILGGSIDDPRTGAVASMVQGLLSSPNALGGMSQGLLGYQDQMARAKHRAQQEQMQAMQLQQQQIEMQKMQRAQQMQVMQDKQRTAMPSPMMQAQMQALQGGGGPTQANAGQIAPVDPMRQALFDEMQSGGITPLQYHQAMIKDDVPIKLGAGESLFSGKGGGYKPLATNPKEQLTPAPIQEYNFAKGQGYQGSFQQFQTELKRAGASRVNVSMDKGFGEKFADNAATQLGVSRDKARAAVQSMASLDMIDSAITSDQVATGPTATFETFGRQLGEAAGMGGKDNAEVLKNTRDLIQGAASLAAGGASMLAGQGQITDGERLLISKAAGGNIDTLTKPEIQQLSSVLRKVHTLTVRGHQGMLGQVDPKFKAFTPFYNVEMPRAQPSTPAPQAGKVWSITPAGGN
jgi:hypothetical protein